MRYYILYTTGKGSDFSKQAKYQQKKLKAKGYRVSMRKINTRAAFEKAWNGMGKTQKGNNVKIDDVYIYCHGSERALLFTPSQAYTINGWNKDRTIKTGNLNALKSKKMNALYLYSCNAGHLDQYYKGTKENGGIGNVASVISKKVQGGAVYAYDGNVSFGLPYGFSLFGGGLAPRVSTTQVSFRNICIKYGTKREPKGRLTYAAGTYRPYGYFPNTTIGPAK